MMPGPSTFSEKGAGRVRNGGRLASLILLSILACASVVLFCRAQLVEYTFEDESEFKWHIPLGGGAGGGEGTGDIVRAGSDDFARSGERAIRLMFWDDGRPGAVSWAGIMQTLPCAAGRKIKVGAWVYYSSTIMPPRENCTVQLRLEYFEDAQGNRLLADHVHLSSPFEPCENESDRWHLIQAASRVPHQARGLRYSVVVTGRDLHGRRGAVWLDDLFVEIDKPRAGQATRPLAVLPSGAPGNNGKAL